MKKAFILVIALLAIGCKRLRDTDGYYTAQSTEAADSSSFSPVVEEIPTSVHPGDTIYANPKNGVNLDTLTYSSTKTQIKLIVQ